MAWLRTDAPMTVDLDSGAYIHPERSGGIIGGADWSRPAGYEQQIDHTLFQRLLGAIVRRFPPMENARMLRGWVGLREMTPDDHALVGPASSVMGFWVVAGLSGHGFMHSPIIGREVSTWLLKGRPDIDLSALAPDRVASGMMSTESLAF